MKYFGIDGCKSGWFYIGLDDDLSYSFGLLKFFSEIKELLPESKLLLVDIPIGLRNIGTKERLCDKEARKILGDRKSSVFPPPSRLTLDNSSYEEASKNNFEFTGRKLSKQSYAISPKIREVDHFLYSNKLQQKIREMHPEVCFWALNNFKPMKFSKKDPLGISERLELLSKYYQKSIEMFDAVKSKYLRKEVARDDIIDALVGAVTARKFYSLKTLPEIPEIDDQGLRMEMVFSKP